MLRCVGRKRTTDKHLPWRMYRHGGGYRFIPPGGKPIALGTVYPEALKRYADLVAQYRGRHAIAAPVQPRASEQARVDAWADIIATRDLSADEDVRILMLRDPLMDEGNAYCLLYRHRGWQVVRLECPGVDLSHLGYEQRGGGR